MKIIYTDGIFDIFHRGHLEYIKKCKNLYKSVYLIVGIINDRDATSYKRTPIFTEEDRYSIIESLIYVDKIIKNAPLIVTPEFIKDNNIDYVVHSFSNNVDSSNQSLFYSQIMDKFIEIGYYSGISTTDIISRIKNNSFDS